MSKIMHCKINMFDAMAVVVIEEDGKFVGDKIYVPINSLSETLPQIANQYKISKIHFVGSTQFVNGIANKFKANMKFSHLKVSVN